MQEALNKTTTIKPKKRRKWLRALIIFVSILVVVRIALPYIVLKYVNKTLGNIQQYYGHVEDIDIALYRGAYVIKDLKIVKVDSITHQRDTTPFFKTPVIDLSIQWKAIFKGKIVGEIEIDDPVLNFVQGQHKNENAKADTTDFRVVIKKLMPLTINHFAIKNGQIHFVDHYSHPPVDVPLTHIEVEATNWSNVNDSNKILPSTLIASGDAYNGHFNLKARVNPLEKKPTFDLDAGISDVDMVNLNNFFEAYGKFKVDKGNFGLYTEFAAKDGAFKGYVKPLIKGLDINHDGNFGQILWSEVMSAGAWVFKNHKKDQVATELPIEGRFDAPDEGLWTAISYVLKNAFIYALQPSIDNKIDIGKVEAPPDKKKTFLQKIFGKKEKNKIRSSI